MIGNKDEFERMQAELQQQDELRELKIAESRSLLTLAKKAMYYTHRDELDQADKTLEEAQVFVDKLKSPDQESHQRIGAVNAALQEWGECFAYNHAVKTGELATQKQLGLSNEDYLLAIADLTGELTRRAIKLSIDKKLDEVNKLRHFIEDIFGEFVSFNFRNGELRKKTDQIRWNLQKIEELLVRLG